MATYRCTNTVAGGRSLKLTERPLHGSSLLGSLRKEVELHSEPFNPVAANPVQQADLNYELTDHLGNVCAVVTGRLLDGNGGGTPMQAELLSAQGYEPFGALLPGRSYSSDSYRFGFNGQEKDDEVYGATGTSYTAEFWQYDPRVARRWNLDPRPNPSISSYATFALNPIGFSDPLGDTVQVSFRAGGFLGLRKNTLNYEDGKLFNRGDGSEYQGKVSKFGEQVVSDLNTLSQGNEGGQTLNELISSSNVFNIQKTSGENKFVPSSVSQAQLGLNPLVPSDYTIQGSGGTIFYNPNVSEGGLNTRGLRDRPGFIGLGHELLGHGLSANRGMANYHSIPGFRSPMDEYFATDMENKIRAEHFLPLRTHYGIGPDGGGVIPLLRGGRGIMSGHDYYGVMKMVPRPILLNR